MSQIELRPLLPEDKYPIATYCNNKKVWDMLRDYIPFPYTLNDAVDFIQISHRSDDQHNYAITLDSKLIGVVGLVRQKDVYRNSAEIGYWIGEPFWGQGYGYQAIQLALKIAFEVLGVVRVFAGVYDVNKPSQRILEKAGFRKEGVFKKAVLKNEKYLDEIRYAILAKEFMQPD
jgi:RimJ/RimL family protein N-acetyltransferase